MTTNNSTHAKNSELPTVGLFKTKNGFLFYPPAPIKQQIEDKFGINNATTFPGGIIFPETLVEKAKAFIGKSHAIVELAYSKQLDLDYFRTLPETEKIIITERYFVDARGQANRSMQSFHAFCITLAETVISMKHGNILPFYKRLGIEERAAQRWIGIGENLKTSKSDDVAAFNRSQLEVLAFLSEETRNVILSRRIPMSVRQMEKLKSNEQLLIGEEKDHSKIEDRIITFIKKNRATTVTSAEMALDVNPKIEHGKHKPRPADTTRKPNLGNSLSESTVDDILESIKSSLKESIEAMADAQMKFSSATPPIVFSATAVQSANTEIASSIKKLQECLKTFQDKVEALNDGKQDE